MVCTKENGLHMDRTAGTSAAFSHSKEGMQEITPLSHEASQCSSKDTSHSPGAACYAQLVALKQAGHRGTLYLGCG